MQNKKQIYRDLIFCMLYCLPLIYPDLGMFFQVEEKIKNSRKFRKVYILSYFKQFTEF